MDSAQVEADARRLSAAELKTLFLFEALNDGQLEWLSKHGHVESYAGGAAISEEGEDATCFFVLLSGTLTMLRRVEDTDVETVRTNQRGVYGGATQSFLRDFEPSRYFVTMRAVTDCECWVIDAAEIGERVREWFPM